jgi:hypothetical protein
LFQRGADKSIANWRALVVILVIWQNDWHTQLTVQAGEGASYILALAIEISNIN